jgi:hypothetical protein
MRRRLGVEAGVKDLFLYPTIDAFAKYINANKQEVESEEYTIVRI